MIHLIVSVALVAGSPAGFGHPVYARQQVQPPATTASAKPAPPQTAPAKAGDADAVADAYFEFLIGRHFDSDGDTEGAIKAYRRALALDPKSSQITSELAEVYARQGQIQESIDLADAALKLDKDNWDAHRILGMLYAELAARGGKPASAGSGQSTSQQAIEHLERSLSDDRVDVVAGVRITLGRLYLQQKNYDKTIAVLKQLQADNPWIPQAVAMLAQAYSAAGRTPDAIALLKDAVEEEPAFYAQLADAYDREQAYTEAAAAYAQASAQNPRDTDLKTKWAAALLNLPDDASAKRARDLLLEVTKATPNVTWPLYLLSRAQRALDDLDGAERSARQILAISPSSVSGAHALAQVFESKRQYSQIVATLEPIVAKPQAAREADTVLILTHLGFAYIEVGRSKDAVSTFERAAQLNPTDGAIRSYLAQALITDKQFDRALTLAHELRAASPADVRLARLEADALRGQGKFDAGLAVLRPVTESPGSGPLGAQALSEFFAADHRYAEAATALKAAISKFPKDLTIQFQYGAILERLKQFDEAERVFLQVIAADANNAPALNYLGYTLVERGQRLPEALAFIQRAVKLDPYSGAYQDSLGWAYFKLKQIDLAEKSLRTAAEQLARDSVVQDHFGDVLAAKGQWAEAVETWRRSLAGDGEAIDRAKIERKIRDAQSRVGKE